MRHLILLTLTWSFSFSLPQHCEIGHNGDILLLNCVEEIYERKYVIKDDNISCGRMDVLRENIEMTLKSRNCNGFKIFDLEAIHHDYLSRFRLNRDQDHQIDLHNLTQRVKDQSLIFGNLDLSGNRVSLLI